jgi:hypothetical protein
MRQASFLERLYVLVAGAADAKAEGELFVRGALEAMRKRGRRHRVGRINARRYRTEG